MVWKRSSASGRCIVSYISNSSPSQDCSKCGAKGHSGQNCRRTQNSTCHKCGKMGHWKVACMSEPRNLNTKYTHNNSQKKGGKQKQGGHQVPPINHLKEENSSSDDDDEYIFRIGGFKGDHKFFPVRCGTQELELLIDSGSKLNILDEAEFSNLNLQKAKTSISAYDSSNRSTKEKCSSKISC